MLECEWCSLMILKPFLGNFKIWTSTATSSQVGCEFEFDVFILRQSEDILGGYKPNLFWVKVKAGCDCGF